MSYRTCRRCGCPYNRKGNLVCVDCGRRLWGPVFSRPQRTVPAAPQAPAAPPLPDPQTPVLFGPRQGEPLSPSSPLVRDANSSVSRWAAAGMAVAMLLAIGVVVLAVLHATHG